MPTILYNYLQSPLGKIELSSNENAILSCKFFDKIGITKNENKSTDSDLFNETKKQLTAYFNSDLKDFNLPLQFIGSDFQKKIWTELLTINFGKTISYLQMAKNLGNYKCIRAAASANGKNPFAIIVPCHRVVGTDGSLTGYSGDLWRKEWLLNHEQKNKQVLLQYD